VKMAERLPWRGSDRSGFRQSFMSHCEQGAGRWAHKLLGRIPRPKQVVASGERARLKDGLEEANDKYGLDVVDKGEPEREQAPAGGHRREEDARPDTARRESERAGPLADDVSGGKELTGRRVVIADKANVLLHASLSTCEWSRLGSERRQDGRGGGPVTAVETHNVAEDARQPKRQLGSAEARRAANCQASAHALARLARSLFGRTSAGKGWTTGGRAGRTRGAVEVVSVPLPRSAEQSSSLGRAQPVPRGVRRGQTYR